MAGERRQRPGRSQSGTTHPDRAHAESASDRSASTSSTPDGPLPILLTPDEVAALLRTTRKAVYAMAERGTLPGVVRLGRRVLFHRDNLLSWLDGRRAPSPGRTRR
ncbi:helix-turn-helix domain-containing protein [Polyangium jinanense]|uniref:Helix-turn-helix domain-containing protein n=1 Tax=Polyangium jinanense TaxID=2829994 RepID=A0A9X3XE83_9BACT|nr:helix-turn-helix domain-containing protein [Polyangium jinanense]MDC3988989.1 helix-turn-helix domain-containing protein [Polyangium jinanense]